MIIIIITIIIIVGIITIIMMTMILIITTTIMVNILMKYGPPPPPRPQAEHARHSISSFLPRRAPYTFQPRHQFRPGAMHRLAAVSTLPVPRPLQLPGVPEGDGGPPWRQARLASAELLTQPALVSHGCVTSSGGGGRRIRHAGCKLVS